MSTADPSDDAAARLHVFLADRMAGRREPAVTPLTGDASDRRYFRVAAADGTSQVVAVYSGPIVFDELPFAIVSRLLETMPVRTPRVLDHDDELGVVVMDDLGDVTLQAHLTRASAQERRALYIEAIDIITVLQQRGRELASPELLPYQLAFDVDKLMFELRFFCRHFLEASRGALLDEVARQALELEFSTLASELAGEPRVFCHRDFHSRNLMVHDGHVYVIDFQDARLGPDTYDLVSLLRDAYVDFTAEQVEDLQQAFLARMHVPHSEAREFRRRFDVMAVQRLLKALGTFGFQATSGGNPRYLESVPRTLGALKSTFASHTRFDRLRRQLVPFVPELL